jgi:hypothetical protein
VTEVEAEAEHISAQWQNFRADLQYLLPLCQGFLSQGIIRCCAAQPISTLGVSYDTIIRRIFNRNMADTEFGKLS